MPGLLPVAWIVERDSQMLLPLLRSAEDMKRYRDHNPEEHLMPLYAHPAPDNRNEVLEEAASVADKMKEVIPMWERPGGPPGNGPKRPALPKEIAAAIRALKDQINGE